MSPSGDGNVLFPPHSQYECKNNILSGIGLAAWASLLWQRWHHIEWKTYWLRVRAPCLFFHRPTNHRSVPPRPQQPRTHPRVYTASHTPDFSFSLLFLFFSGYLHHILGKVHDRVSPEAGHHQPKRTSVPNVSVRRGPPLSCLVYFYFFLFPISLLPFTPLPALV